MNAGNAAPLRGIVHAGQIVEEQRSGVEVFKRDGQISGGYCIQAISRRHLKDHARPDQAAGIVEHMTKRLLEVRVEGGRQRKASSEGIREWRCANVFMQFAAGTLILILPFHVA